MKYKKLEIGVIVEAGIPVDAIKEFIDHRVLLKKPMTQGALERNMRQAYKAPSIGMTPEEMIHKTIDKGWLGITIDWFTPKTGTKTRDRPLKDDLNDKSWASNVVPLVNKNVEVLEG